MTTSTWRGRDRARIAGAAGATVATGLALLLLMAQRGPPRRGVEPPSVQVRLLDVAPKVAPVATVLQRSGVAAVGGEHVLPRAPTPTPALKPTLSALPAEPPSSAPLRLDEQTLRRAIAGARGPVRRMADGAAVELDSSRPSATQGLATAIAETAVPDCLAPNPSGSLLSVPLLAYKALAGKCK